MNLDQIIELTAQDMAAVNATILEQLNSDVTLINQLGYYIISGGGKRIRPMIAVLAARALHSEGDKHITIAALIEFIHTATLLHAFTYDPSLGVFCLSHEKVRFPESGNMYSINEGNYIKFPLGVKKYIKYCQEQDEATQRPYTSRYIGSLVADFHRNLLKGGIYIYPSTASHPQGKLRLLYECNPMAFLAEQAGGKASDGKNRILDITPQKLHQRAPFFVGTKSMVEDAERFIADYPDE